MEKWLESAWRGHQISLHGTREMLCAARNILINEPNVVEVKKPVIVVGDIHGQFFDLLEMFKKVGRPPEHTFLFLGDFVDRGSYSIETITLLLLLKITYPNLIVLLRGNHESRQATRTYGFYRECLAKYNAQAKSSPDAIPDEFNPEIVSNSSNAAAGGQESVGNLVWEAFMTVFDCLPIASIIGSSVIAIHGGLSPSLLTIDSIRAIHRFREVPHEGPMADLLWGDPHTDNGWSKNSRGVGWVFGGDVVRKFLSTNNLSMIVRSHQLALEGIQEFAGGRLLTVWSAPNYTGRLKNLATVLKLTESGEGEVIYFDVAPAEVYLQHKAELEEIRKGATVPSSKDDGETMKAPVQAEDPGHKSDSDDSICGESATPSQATTQRDESSSVSDSQDNSPSFDAASDSELAAEGVPSFVTGQGSEYFEM